MAEYPCLSALLWRRYEDALAAADRTLLVANKDVSAWDWRSKSLFQLGRGAEGIDAPA